MVSLVTMINFTLVTSRMVVVFIDEESYISLPSKNQLFVKRSKSSILSPILTTFLNSSMVHDIWKFAMKGDQ